MKDKIITHVMLLMGWPEYKAEAWYIQPNPNFGGTSAAALVFMDLGHKVLDYIKMREEEV